MTSKNMKFENLKIYLARPMEDDILAGEHEDRFIKGFKEAGILEENMYGPCKHEESRTGYDVRDSNKMIGGWRMAGLNDKADAVYRAIWVEDIWRIVTADIIVVHIRPGLRYTGTAVEGAFGNLANFMDPIRESYSEEIQKRYTEVGRPLLKDMGFIKPIYLVTSAKTEINGTMVHKIIRGSGGRVFKTLKECIEWLKENYK